MRQLALTIILTLANLSPTAAEPLWQPEGGGTGISAQTRVVGDIQTFPDGAGGLRVRGWVVDGFSATDRTTYRSTIWQANRSVMSQAAASCGGATSRPDSVAQHFR